MDLINLRLNAAQKIGALKAGDAQPCVYRPEREAELIARLREANNGPLDDAGLTLLFREIISLCRGAEAPLSVALLGPAGTYSEIAARQQFGRQAHLEPCVSIAAACRATESGQTDCCLLPVENSLEGGVGETLDQLLHTPLTICGEVLLGIRHNLLSKAGDLTQVREVVAHPQALAQCREWLSEHLPAIPVRPVASTAEAARLAAEQEGLAAIANSVAAEIHKLPELALNIQDRSDNTTRFLVLGPRPTPPSGDDKTSLLLSAHNRPGALLHLLEPLVNIDMTRLESRPSRGGLWDYVFFIDFRGHRDDPAIAGALKTIHAEAGLFKVLGSYPRAV